MRSWRAESLLRRTRWLGPTALLALAPKCVLCLAAYAGLGSALGVGGRELCGGDSRRAFTGGLIAIALVAMLGLAALVRAVRGGWRCRAIPAEASVRQARSINASSR